MMAKYHLYRYMATWTYVLSQQGGTLYKPLYFEFPDDPGAYSGNNVMIGPSLKVQSSVDLVNNTTEFYFPKGLWCSVYTVEPCLNIDQGKNITLPSANFSAHLREGFIIPLQNAT